MIRTLRECVGETISVASYAVCDTVRRSVMDGTEVPCRALIMTASGGERFLITSERSIQSFLDAAAGRVDGTPGPPLLVHVLEDAICGSRVFLFSDPPADDDADRHDI